MEFDSMFDVSNLSFRDQFEAAVAVSGVCLVAAIVLREWFTDREIRIIARVLGLAGWAVVVTFAWRMTLTNETLATQIMVKKGVHDATQIADPVRVVAVASEFSQTVGEATVSLVQYRDGRFGPVSVIRGRSSRVGDRNQPDHGQPSVSDGAIFSAGSSTVSVPTGESGIRF
jgi:hypothetical protein